MKNTVWLIFILLSHVILKDLNQLNHSALNHVETRMWAEISTNKQVKQSACKMLLQK